VNTPSTSVNPTSQNNIFKTKLVHQWKTRSNTPMPTIMEEVEPITNHTVVTNNQPITISSQPTRKQTNLTATPTRRSPRLNNGQAINSSKHNSAKQISKKRLQKLIDEQTICDKHLLQMQKTNGNIKNTIPPKVPTTSSLIQLSSCPT